MLKTEVKSLRLLRLSSVPNANGSYAFRIVEVDKAEVAELLEAVEGVYDGQDGGKILYSRNRLGKLNVEFSAPIRVVEQQKDRQPTGRHFINLVDTGLEEFGDFANKVVLAEKFGISNAPGAVAAFFGVKGQVAKAAQETAAAGPDKPVLENTKVE